MNINLFKDVSVVSVVCCFMNSTVLSEHPSPLPGPLFLFEGRFGMDGSDSSRHCLSVFDFSDFSFRGDV